MRMEEPAGSVLNEQSKRVVKGDDARRELAASVAHLEAEKQALEYQLEHLQVELGLAKAVVPVCYARNRRSPNKPSR